jgi:hypothetical protein
MMLAAVLVVMVGNIAGDMAPVEVGSKIVVSKIIVVSAPLAVGDFFFIFTFSVAMQLPKHPTLKIVRTLLTHSNGWFWFFLRKFKGEETDGQSSRLSL